MANGGSKNSGGAPTYDRIGIDASTAQATLAQYQERVAAAVRLGWELEELIARSYLLDEPPPVKPAAETMAAIDGEDAPRSPFLPDLFHAQSPRDRLQSVLTIVRAQPAIIFAGGGNERVEKLQTLVVGLPVTVLDADCHELRTTTRTIEEAVLAILLDPAFTGETSGKPDPISDMLLSGYELGKALSGTRWMIWAAHMLTPIYERRAPPPDAARVNAAWSEMFDSARVSHIERHLANLTPVYGGRITMAVTKSVDYWRAALLDQSILAGPSVQATRQSAMPAVPVRVEWTHGVLTRQHAEVDLHVTQGNINQEMCLFGALCQQADAWYDLLTMRRSPDAFPITGLISNLLRQLAQRQLAATRDVLSPWLRSAAVGIGVLLILVVVLFAVAFVAFGSGAAQQVATGGVVALGGGAFGSIAALLARPATAAKQVGGQVQEGASAVSAEIQRVGSVAQPLLPPHFSWRTIVQTAANDVVNQLRLEEIYLGVSEPLVRYVLGPGAPLDGQKRPSVDDDPSAAARRFLGLIYDSTPNIDRLGSIFLDLYRAASNGDTVNT